MSNLLLVIRYSDDFALLLGNTLRARLIGPLSALARATAYRCRRALQEHRRRAEERAMVRDFASLSDATLRDIGLTRGEFGSFRAEATGRAEITRLRVMLDVRGKACGAGAPDPRP